MKNAEFLRRLCANSLRVHRGDIKKSTRDLHYTLTEFHGMGRALLRAMIADYLTRIARDDDVKAIIARGTAGQGGTARRVPFRNHQ
jgi:hypothetical protein